MKARRIRFEAARWALRMALGAASVAAAGCMVGPNYKPPLTKMPAAYREANNTSTTGPTTGPTTAPTERTSFAATGPAEIRWWRQFGDEQLTGLVEKSVKANYGVAVAQARLREARGARR